MLQEPALWKMKNEKVGTFPDFTRSLSSDQVTLGFAMLRIKLSPSPLFERKPRRNFSSCTGPIAVVFSLYALPSWRNRNTRSIQDAVRFCGWRFKSSRGHISYSPKWERNWKLVFLWLVAKKKLMLVSISSERTRRKLCLFLPNAGRCKLCLMF